MNNYSPHQKQKATNRGSPLILYRVVFSGWVSTLLALLLIVSFCIQPLRADASQSEDDATLLPPQITDDLIERIDQADPAPLAETEIETALEPVSTSGNEPSPEVVPETPSVNEVSDVVPSNFDVASSTVENPPENTGSVTGSASSTVPDGVASESSLETSTSTSSSGSSPDTDTGTTTAPAPPKPDVPDIETAPEIDGEGVVATSSATTTIDTYEDTATTTESVAPFLTVESDQVVQFDKTDCVAVADGSYYCRERENVPTTITDGLFSLPDADGDLEIFLQRDGELQQLTSNLVDDASPQYDPMSDTMVWHRLVSDRYQIVVYDLSSGEEFQLTDTASNNMEPFRADNYIVWQHWSNNAWQIMLYDGSDIELLTNTSEHNIAPNIRNGLVVWHRVTGNSEQSIEVYDIQAKTQFTITDTDAGGEVSNPRMVLVFESTLPSGDVVTKGFDLVTGEVTTFAQTPTTLPTEIPDPEATGETRALLQNKTMDEDDVVDDTTQPQPVDPPPDTATSTGGGLATTSLEYDVDLRTLELDQAPTTTVDVLVPDVVILPFSELVAVLEANNEASSSTATTSDDQLLPR